MNQFRTNERAISRVVSRLAAFIGRHGHVAERMRRVERGICHRLSPSRVSSLTSRDLERKIKKKQPRSLASRCFAISRRDLSTSRAPLPFPVLRLDRQRTNTIKVAATRTDLANPRKDSSTAIIARERLRKLHVRTLSGRIASLSVWLGTRKEAFALPTART